MSSGLLNVEGLRAVFVIVVYRYRVAIRSDIHRDPATDKSLVQSSCKYIKLDAALGGISRVATLGSRLLDISTGTDNSRDRQPWKSAMVDMKLMTIEILTLDLHREPLATRLNEQTQYYVQTSSS